MTVPGSLARAKGSPSGNLRWAYALGALGMFMVIGLLWRAGPIATLAAIRQAGWGTVAIMLAPAGGMLLHCLGWLALLPGPLRPRLGLAFATYVAAQAGDELGVGVAGEPAKIFVLPPSARPQALAAVALDNLAQLIGLGGYLLLALPGLGMFGKAAPVGTPRLVASLGAGLLGLGLLGLVLMFLWRRRESLRPRRPWIERLARLAGQAQAAWRAHPGSFLRCVLLHLLGKSWIVVEMALALFILRADPWFAFCLAPCSVVASLVGAAIPGQLGIVELGLAAAGAMTGMAPATIVALALLRRVRAILWIGFGVLLIRKVLGHGTDALESSH